MKTTAARKPARRAATPARARAAQPLAAVPAVEEARSLAEQAYHEIKQRILSLELRPGQFLNELALCQLLGFGRTPVHQAVHRLMGEGLLEIIPRKGLLIRPDSMNEILELLEARWAVEPNIAALAAERVTPDQVKQLQTLLAESSKITDQRFRQRFMSVDRIFHATIAAAASNHILADVMRPLHERSARIWHLQVWQADDLEVTQAEHEAVLDAIARGDKSNAAKAMQQHIASLRRRITRGRGNM